MGDELPRAATALGQVRRRHECWLEDVIGFQALLLVLGVCEIESRDI